MPATIADLESRKETPLLIDAYMHENGITDIKQINPVRYVDWRVRKFADFCRVFGIERSLTAQEYRDLEAWTIGGKP